MRLAAGQAIPVRLATILPRWGSRSPHRRPEHHLHAAGTKVTFN